MIRFAPKHVVTPAQPACVARRAVVSKIADAIREMGYSGEAMTPEAFELRGLPRAVVERFAHDAQALARRQAVRQIG